jgi:hypothetical protein
MDFIPDEIPDEIPDKIPDKVLYPGLISPKLPKISLF